jgi:S1-C subfamily serine protease
MDRFFRVHLPFVLVCLLVSWSPGLLVSSRGDEKPALKDALALQETLQDAIKTAEPSMACILVSRSDVYERFFHQRPPADNPGKLGGFDPSAYRGPVPMRPFGRRFGFDGQGTPEQESRKYDLADPSNVPEAYGSGVLIDAQKLLILTNYHVIRDATKVYVRLPGEKGSYADIHAADPRSDLAVLRLLGEKLWLTKGQAFKEIKFGDGGAVRKGEFVVTLAHPFAAGFRDGSPSASWGIVSNLQRRAVATFTEEQVVRALHVCGVLIQTDARLNLGCSGGALINLRGEMIGLTTSRAALTGSEMAGGFAIPLDANIKRILGKLKDGVEVEYGFLGVGPPQPRKGEGFLIEAVTPGSPAQKAGLQAGQRILSINGTPIHDFDELFVTVSTLLAGSEVRLEIEKNGHRELVAVTLAKLHAPGKIIASKKPAAIRGCRVGYTSVLVTQRTMDGLHLGNVYVKPGVLVTEVQPGSPADLAHLKVNDVITHVNNQEVNAPAEFCREAGKIPSGKELKLKLLSPESSRFSDSEIITIH